MGNIECGKYQLIFASAENVLVEPIFFLDKKKKQKQKTKKEKIVK